MNPATCQAENDIKLQGQTSMEWSDLGHSRINVQRVDVAVQAVDPRHVAGRLLADNMVGLGGWHNHESLQGKGDEHGG